MQLQVKTFLKKLLIFISIGLLFCIFLFIISDKYDPEINFRIGQLLSKADSVEALAVGNSHSCALDFNALGLNGYRVALGGNDISEAVYQIKALTALLPNLKIILFNISYFSLYTDNSSFPDYYSIFSKEEYHQFINRFPFAEAQLDTFNYSDFVIINTDKLSPLQKNKLGPALDVIMGNTSDRIKVRWSYYNSIPSFKWIKGDFTNYFRSRISVIVRSDHWHGVINNILSGNNHKVKSLNSYYHIDNYGQPIDSLRNSYKSNDSLNILARYFIAPMYLRDTQIVLKNNPDVVNKNIRELISVIEYLKSHNIKIIFYTTPVYKSFTDNFDKSIIRITKDKMQMLEKKYGVSYFDFSGDTSFVLNNKFFYNSDHLNRSGAFEFSRYFRKKLESSNTFLTKN